MNDNIIFKVFHDKELGEAFTLIAKHKLYNAPDEDSTTILPLLETGSNYQGDTPESCVLAFDKVSQKPIAMGLLTVRQNDEDVSYSVGHLYVLKAYRGRGLGSELIERCLDLARESEKTYWYYTDASRGLYEKHKLNDVVLFEAVEGIYRDEPNESEFYHSNSIEEDYINPIQSHKSSKKKRFGHS